MVRRLCWRLEAYWHEEGGDGHTLFALCTAGEGCQEWWPKKAVGLEFSIITLNPAGQGRPLYTEQETGPIVFQGSWGWTNYFDTPALQAWDPAPFRRNASAGGIIRFKLTIDELK